MLFSDHTREYYPNAPVHEVICQLRFPTILSINQNEPAETVGTGDAQCQSRTAAAGHKLSFFVPGRRLEIKSDA